MSDRATEAAARLRSLMSGGFVIHDTDWTDDDPDLPEDRPCFRCGKNPAEGFASVWTQAGGERWYCHGDDDESPTCYEGANQ